MEKDLEKYEKYLQEVVNWFEKHPIFLNNLGFVNEIVQDFYLLSRSLPDTLNNEEEKEMLGNEEIILHSREIISSIDEDLLKEFDELVTNHKIVFFEKDTKVKTGVFPINNDRFIAINKKGGYNDVVDLIHEYMHYYNYSKNDLYFIITEFFSIYFEMYAIDYLNEEKKVSKNELNFKDRILNDKKHIINLKGFIPSFYLYYKCKSFDIEEYAKIFPGFTAKNFDILYDYNMHVFTTPNQYNMSFGKLQARTMMYTVGLFLALYSRSCKSKKDVLKLYKEINNNENNKLTLKELLTKYNFTLSSEDKKQTCIDTLNYFTDEKARSL